MQKGLFMLCIMITLLTATIINITILLAFVIIYNNDIRVNSENNKNDNDFIIINGYK